MAGRRFVRPSRAKVGAPAGDAPAAAAASAATAVTPHVAAISSTIKTHLPDLAPSHVQSAAECVSKILSTHLGCTEEGKIPTLTAYFDNELEVKLSDPGFSIVDGELTSVETGSVFVVKKGTLAIRTDDVFAKIQRKHGLTDDTRDKLYIKRICLKFTGVSGSKLAASAIYPDATDTESIREWIITPEGRREYTLAEYAAMIPNPDNASETVHIVFTDASKVQVANHPYLMEKHMALYNPDLISHTLFHYTKEAPPALNVANDLAEDILSVAGAATPACIHTKAATATREGHKAMPESHRRKENNLYAGTVSAAMAHVLLHHEKKARKHHKDVEEFPGQSIGSSAPLPLLQLNDSAFGGKVCAVVTLALLSHSPKPAEDNEPSSSISDSDSDSDS